MNWGLLGAAAVLGIAATGSAVGAGIAGQAAIGAWKRNIMANKPASFLLMGFAGAPLTQTIYGFLLMNKMLGMTGVTENAGLILGVGLFGGLGICFSAIAQGQAAAASCDAFGQTGKGFGQYMTVVGLCETIAVFVLAFSWSALGKLAS